MADWCGSERDPKQKEEFVQLLLEHIYADVFAHADGDLGRTTQLHHKIHTGEAPPIRQHVRRVSPHAPQVGNPAAAAGNAGKGCDPEVNKPMGSPYNSGQEERWHHTLLRRLQKAE